MIFPLLHDFWPGHIKLKLFSGGCVKFWRWSAALARTGAAPFQLFARASDLQALGLEGEPELVRNFILQLADAVALELHDLVAVLADDVVVIWMVRVVRIVKLEV